MANLEEFVHFELRIIEVMDKGVPSRQEIVEHLLYSLILDLLQLNISSSQLIHQTPMVKRETVNKEAKVRLINGKEIFVEGVRILVLMQVIVSFVSDVIIL